MKSFNEAEVKALIAEHLGIDANTLVPTTRFIEDLGADSLDMVELVMAFEQKYELADDQLDKYREKIATYADLIDALTKELASEHA